MALTNEDIEERFEVGEDRVIRWKRIDPRGLPRWAAEKARELNRKAGEEVNFFLHPNQHMVVKVYGGTVAESRIRKVLQRQTAQDVAVSRERSAAKRAKRATAGSGDEAKPLASGGAPKAQPWDDPTDPDPGMESKAAWDEWALREYDRVRAWQAKQKESDNG